EESMPVPDKPGHPSAAPNEESRPSEAKTQSPKAAVTDASTPQSSAGEHVSNAALARERHPLSNTGKRSARCSELLSRLQLGEGLSPEDRAVLQKECQR